MGKLPKDNFYGTTGVGSLPMDVEMTPIFVWNIKKSFYLKFLYKKCKYIKNLINTSLESISTNYYMIFYLCIVLFLNLVSDAFHT